MKFRIQREALLKPLQMAIGVVERRQTLPVLSNFLIQASKEGLNITATDLEVELLAKLSSPLEVSGDITVPARKLIDICRTLPEQAAIDVELDNDRMLLRSGKSRFTLSTLPASEFPAVEDIKDNIDFSLAQRDLKKLIEKTHFSMAQQDVRYYLNGLMLEIDGSVLRAVATDGHRLSVSQVAVDSGGKDSLQIIVPRKGVQELLRLLEDSDVPVQIRIGSNHLRAELPDIRFTTKLIDGRFPDYQKVIPKQANKKVLADRETLRQALTRTSILSNEKYRGVRLTLADSVLRLQAHNPEQEEAEEEIDVTYAGDGLEIGFNVNYLLDALQAVDGDQIQIGLSDSNSSCLISAPDAVDSRYVVMPMRL